MAKIEGLTANIDVELSVSEETAELCVTLLNLHLKQTKREIVFREHEGRIVEIYLPERKVSQV